MQINDTKLKKIWEKAPYCSCNQIDCSPNNHRLCPICGEKMLWGAYWGHVTQRNSYFAWDIDHIIPISKGETSELSNLRAVHARCNRSRK